MRLPPDKDGAIYCFDEGEVRDMRAYQRDGFWHLQIAFKEAVEMPSIVGLTGEQVEKVLNDYEASIKSRKSKP